MYSRALGISRPYYVQMESTVQISSVTFQVVGFTPTIDAGGDWSTVLNAFAPKSRDFTESILNCSEHFVRRPVYSACHLHYKNGSTFKLCYHEVYHGSTTAGRFSFAKRADRRRAPGDAYTFFAAETSYPSGGPFGNRRNTPCRRIDSFKPNQTKTRRQERRGIGE